MRVCRGERGRRRGRRGEERQREEQVKSRSSPSEIGSQKYNGRDRQTVARAARPSRGISLIGRPPATSEHSKNIRRDTQKEAVLRHRGAIWKCLLSVDGHLSPDSISGSLSSPSRRLAPPSRSLALSPAPTNRLTVVLNPRGFAHMSTIYFLPAHKSFSG